MATDPGKFTEDGSGAVLSQCLACERLMPGPGWKCGAFPGGIPDEIVANRADHREPIRGDKGLTFVPLPGTPKPYLVRLARKLDSLP